MLGIKKGQKGCMEFISGDIFGKYSKMKIQVMTIVLFGLLILKKGTKEKKTLIH